MLPLDCIASPGDLSHATALHSMLAHLPWRHRESRFLDCGIGWPTFHLILCCINICPCRLECPPCHIGTCAPFSLFCSAWLSRSPGRPPTNRKPSPPTRI